MGSGRGQMPSRSRTCPTTSRAIPRRTRPPLRAGSRYWASRLTLACRVATHPSSAQFTVAGARSSEGRDLPMAGGEDSTTEGYACTAARQNSGRGRSVCRPLAPVVVPGTGRLEQPAPERQLPVRDERLEGNDAAFTIASDGASVVRHEALGFD